MRRSLVLVACCVMLAGCGGDGGSAAGSSSGTGTTPATPTPSSGGLHTGEVKPASDATFIAASMDVTTTGDISQTGGVITGGTTSNRTTVIDTPRFSGSYDASGYHLADAANSMVFGPAQLTYDTTAPNGNGTVVLTAPSATAENYLALYQASTYISSYLGSGYTTARYGGIGGWQHTIVNGSSRQTRLNYFGYGTATPPAAMPHAGTVKYSILNAGNYATDTDLWFVSQESGAFLTVDFAAGTVSGNLTLSGINFYKSETGGFGYLPIQGAINGNAVTGSMSNGSLSTDGTVPAQFHLLFVGPSANEFVITYVANDGRQAVVGGAVGIVNPYGQ